MQRHRIGLTICLSAGLVVATVVHRGPDDHEDLRLDLFWAGKLAWNRCADCVIAGDSRICRGVAPAAMESVLDYRRVLNFAFDSSGYSEPYLRAVDRVLDPGINPRAVILGITPYSLTRAAASDSEFEYRRDLMPFQSTAGLYAMQSLRRLSPMRIDQVYEELSRDAEADAEAPPGPPDGEYRPDGWLPMARRNGDTSMYAEQYLTAFENNPVDPQLTAGLLRQVRQWCAAGIRVYAFRPPIAKPILQIEEECSRFDEPGFVAAFQRAGGIWIPIDALAYDTYDGSHLGRDEAIRLSRTLARQILHVERPDARTAHR